MSAKGILILLFVVFTLGGAVGQAIELDPPAKVKVITLHDTKIKEKKVYETKYESDPDCVNALAISQKVLDAGNIIADSTEEMFDIMSNLRLAVAESDSNTVNALETQLRLLEGTVTKASLSFSESKVDLADIIKNCE